MRPKIFAYHFPNWHRDPRNEQWFGQGWTEWKLVDAARPRFPGHRQPRVPALGRFDEADPAVAAQQIDLAADHGVDGFLVDFYWYDDGPFLERAVDALFAAPNSNRVEIALMWANHNYVDLFPATSPSPRLLKEGALDRAAFDRMASFVVDNYFTQPNYHRVEGRPWLSIYEIGTLVRGLGGVEQAADALRHLDDLTREAGFPGVHVDVLVWGFAVLPSANAAEDLPALLAALDVRSTTSYVWVHHVDLQRQSFPSADVAKVRAEAFADYERYHASLPVPFYPNVTVGWDPSPRTDPGVEFAPLGYPWTPVLDCTPDEFAESLRTAHDAVRRWDPPHPKITINAWNEWTEGSALLPDETHGTGFLRAIRDEFGPTCR